MSVSGAPVTPERVAMDSLIKAETERRTGNRSEKPSAEEDPSNEPGVTRMRSEEKGPGNEDGPAVPKSPATAPEEAKKRPAGVSPAANPPASQ